MILRTPSFIGPWLPLIGLIVGCSTDKPTAPTITYSLTVAAGNHQVATTGDTLPQSVVIRLTDAATGAPVPNATISWQVGAGSGALVAMTTTTDAGGTSNTRWVLGPTDSAQSVTATTPDGTAGGAPLSVAFAATGFARSALHWIGVFDGDSITTSGTTYDVATHFHFVLANAHNDSVYSAPVVNVPSIQWQLATGVGPSPPPTCSATTGVLTLTCPVSSGAAYNGFYAVTVQQASFDGVANPSYRGSFDLYVGSTSNVQLHLVGAFDGDSSVAIGPAYNVAQHFHFIVADAAGDSVASVPDVNLPSVQWVLTSGIAPIPAPSCSAPTGVLTLTCPASSGKGSNGLYTVTVQPGSVPGVSNPSYRGTVDLYVGPTSNVQLHFVGVFDGDSTVAFDTTYNVARHFRFVVADVAGDSVGSVPVVNLPSIQWVKRSGPPPTGPPVCTPMVGVLLLRCPASDSYGAPANAPFTGYYVLSVQPGSLNGVTNPAYRPTFDLNVLPPFPTVQCSYSNGRLTCTSVRSGARLTKR